MRMWNGAVLSLVLLSFSLGLCEFVIIGIVPEIAASLSVSLTQAGLAISCFAIANAVSTPVLSLWGSRFSPYRFVLVLTGLFVLGNGAAFFIADYAMFLWNRIFLAAAGGVLFSVSLAFAPYIAPRKYMASIVAWINAGFSVAAVFGLPLGSLAVQYVPWRFIFLGLGLMAFCTMLLMVVSLPKTTGLQRHVSMRHELSLLRDRRIWHGAVFVCFNAASSYCWYSYVAPMLTDVMGFGTAWVSPVLLMLGMGTIFSTLAGGKIAEQGGIFFGLSSLCTLP